MNPVPTSPLADDLATAPSWPVIIPLGGGGGGRRVEDAVYGLGTPTTRP